MQQVEQTKREELETLAVGALRRMDTGRLEFAVAFLLDFAPKGRDVRSLKVIPGGALDSAPRDLNRAFDRLATNVVRITKNSD